MSAGMPSLNRLVIWPEPAASAPELRQMIGDVWEWTASPYVAYPRFRPAATSRVPLPTGPVMRYACARRSFACALRRRVRACSAENAIRGASRCGIAAVRAKRKIPVSNFPELPTGGGRLTLWKN